MSRRHQGGVRVLGVRHHGPGSARAVRAELEDFAPDAVLVEGPSDADPLLSLVGGLEPPVALLAHAPGGRGGPRRSAFWPFASFSPEWQALHYAHEHGCDVRFCDLPASVSLAVEGDGDGGNGKGARPADPLAELAAAAGYDDAERWWDDTVEHRSRERGSAPPPSPFAAIAEAMTEVRARTAPGPLPLHEASREAHMRRTVRSALRAGHARIAVVCGAWHVPALLERPKAADDAALLRRLPRVTAETTWIPWSHGRLSASSGYGAGVRAPGWYHHLFTAPDRPLERWLSEAARLLRAEGEHVSTAHVIEGVRLCEALAALRGRPLPGLDEAGEAVVSVLCEGSALKAERVRAAMETAERLGRVPLSVPRVPLQRDLEAQQRRLRLRPEAEPRDLDLDLREENGRARSALLHRLRMLDVDWGVPLADPVRVLGSFHERWRLAWLPEMEAAVVDASLWGTDVASAADARTRERAAHAGLTDLTALAERCLKAGLDGALEAVLDRASARAAHVADTAAFMDAVPPLARAARYGDVRGTGSAPLRRVAAMLLDRVCAGIGPAVSGLSEEAAAGMCGAVEAVHRSAALIGGASERSWWEALVRLSTRTGVPGLVAGRVHRLLRDGGRLDDGELLRRLSRAVSRGSDPQRAAAWITGFLGGEGLVLVHDEGLLHLVDEWLCGLDGESFDAVLPLLRRTFGGFSNGERRAIAQRVRTIGADPRTASRAPEADLDRASAAMATAALLLDRETSTTSGEP
ncbi:DUF5682 family protein [Nocardiopsis sp. RSe5-2]|uniref:DUF5682 family protein n=1 Tax=Nocardiopsis endophytica TaxID=3018445 RepID=A0ABT4U6Z2_9ACTN|nr:DUF5682 family protein [Nocardiopsis endophytica]MDA2812722.1 DUF5682 family protein [Nocardiopsis endophytica]